jgi:cytidyltransferase-like protein
LLRVGPVFLVARRLVVHNLVMLSLGAQILSFDEFDANRPLGRIVATSGGYDPVHPGHISSIQASREYGDIVVVIVNGDAFLAAKKGRPFQDLQTRCLIVSAIRGVDYVIPFEIEGDRTVTEALRRLRPDVFTKGGDRVDAESIPEWGVCRELGIEVVTGVGEDKRWSSSWFLQAWASNGPEVASAPPAGAG